MSIKHGFHKELELCKCPRRPWINRPVPPKVLMLAVLFMLAGGPARAVNQDGSIDGLKAKFVDVNGIKTRYYEMGSGEPMVLIHAEEGFSGHASANYFAKNIPGLAKHFHVFALDRLGSGLTDNPKTDKDYNIHAEMDHIVQFIQTLKLGKVNLVGHSHGGGMALFIAVEHPDIIRTLTIMDSITAAPLGPGAQVSEGTGAGFLEMQASSPILQAGGKLGRRVLGSGDIYDRPAEIEGGRSESEGRRRRAVRDNSCGLPI